MPSVKEAKDMLTRGRSVDRPSKPDEILAMVRPTVVCPRAGIVIALEAVG